MYGQSTNHSKEKLALMLQKLNPIEKTNHPDQRLIFLTNDEFIVTHLN